MPLKLGVLGQQIAQMVQAHVGEDRHRSLEQARELLHSLDPAELSAKLEQRAVRLPWLVAVPGDSVAGALPAKEPPAGFSVVSADGSSVAPDRHGPIRFHLINVGYAVLTYGEFPSAILDSAPQLCFRDEELYLDPQTRNVPVEGTRLSAKMCLEEMRALWHASRRVGDGPLVALRDGSLITWGLQNEDPSFVQQQFLGEFLGYLEKLRASAVPVASYISYPGAREVVNSLRVWICPRDSLDCVDCRPSEGTVLCRALLGRTDRELFGFLNEGERSDVFGSKSAILDRYGIHRVRFFYMNVGGEIVRTEAPQWVTSDLDTLDLVQSLVYDQCRRSGFHPPYPPALQEAHEQAVISTGDRRLVEAMVQTALAARGVVYSESAKALSKTRRAV